MTLCPWCGDQHPADKLCSRAQRGMTRRAFCFLFGAGTAAALALPKLPSFEQPWLGPPTGAPIRELINKINYAHSRFAIDMPGGDRFEFNGYIRSLEPTVYVDGPVSARVEIQPIGPIHTSKNSIPQRQLSLLVANENVGLVRELEAPSLDRLPIDVSTPSDIDDTKIVGLQRQGSFTLDLNLEDGALDTLFREMKKP